MHEYTQRCIFYSTEPLRERSDYMCKLCSVGGLYGVIIVRLSKNKKDSVFLLTFYEK